MDNLGASTGSSGRKALESMRRECHLPVALGTLDWAALSSVPQHCCHLLRLGQQPQPLQSTAMLHIYCQAVSLSWFSLLRFFDCFVLLALFTVWDLLKFFFPTITKFSKFLKARAGDAIQARCLAFNLNQHSHSTLQSRYGLKEHNCSKTWGGSVPCHQGE